MIYEKFSDIKTAVAGCSGCAYAVTRKNTVFGEGSLHAKVMFVARDPGQWRMRPDARSLGPRDSF